MSDEYVIGIILWWNQETQKGMAKDADGNVYAFDWRNLDEQLKESGAHETHIVAIEVNYRNGHGLARLLHCPTVQEAAEWGNRLRDAYEKNLIEQELRKAEKRGYVSSRGQRGVGLFVR